MKNVCFDTFSTFHSPAEGKTKMCTCLPPDVNDTELCFVIYIFHFSSLFPGQLHNCRFFSHLVFVPFQFSNPIICSTCSDVSWESCRKGKAVCQSVSWAGSRQRVSWCGALTVSNTYFIVFWPLPLTIPIPSRQIENSPNLHSLLPFWHSKSPMSTFCDIWPFLCKAFVLAIWKSRCALKNVDNEEESILFNRHFGLAWVVSINQYFSIALMETTWFIVVCAVLWIKLI